MLAIDDSAATVLTVSTLSLLCGAWAGLFTYLGTSQILVSGLAPPLRSGRRTTARRAVCFLAVPLVVAAAALPGALVVLVTTGAARATSGAAIALTVLGTPCLAAWHYRSTLRWVATDDGLPGLRAVERDSLARRVAADLQAGLSTVCALLTPVAVSLASVPAGMRTDSAMSAAVAVVATCTCVLAASGVIVWRPGLARLLIGYRQLGRRARPDLGIIFTDPSMHNDDRWRLKAIQASLARRFAKLSKAEPAITRPSFVAKAEDLMRASAAEGRVRSPALPAAVLAAVTGDVGPLRPDPDFSLASERLRIPWAAIAAGIGVLATIASTVVAVAHLVWR